MRRVITCPSALTWRRCDMDAPLNRVMCCICLSEEVKPTETACSACRNVFTLVDEQQADMSNQAQRVATGPTDR